MSDYETQAEREEREATEAGKFEIPMTLEDFEEIRAEEIRCMDDPQ